MSKMHILSKLRKNLVLKNNLMHTQRFAQRLVALADTPEKVQAIVDTLAACVTTQQITRKDVIHLTQQLRAL